MKKLTGRYSRFDRDKHASGVTQDICPVCDNKKYVLKTVHSDGNSTMYAKEACPRCMQQATSTELHDSSLKTTAKADKAFNGTGYLRNRKRRRKYQ